MILLFTQTQRKEFWQILKENQLIGFVLITVAIALSAGMSVLTDSIQIMTGVSLPFLLIFSVFTLIYALNKLRSRKLVFPFLLIAVNLFVLRTTFTVRNKMDIRFYTQVRKELTEQGNWGFDQSQKSVTTLEPFFRNANYIFVFPDMRRFTDNYLPVNLSVYEIPYDVEEAADASYVVPSIENSSFYRYVEKNKLRANIFKAILS